MSWAFTEQKVEQRIREVQRAAIVARLPLQEVRMRRGEGRLAAPDLDDSAWEALDDGLSWGTDRESTVWLRARARVPADWAGLRVVLHARPVACEILAYVDGAVAQALDKMHHGLVLADEAEAGREYAIALEAYSGLHAVGTDPSVVGARVEQHRLEALELRCVDVPTDALGHDMRFAYETAQTLDRASREYSAIMRLLDLTTNGLDFRRGGGSPEFRASARAARDFLRTSLRASLPERPLAPTLWAVGHAHIDTAWLWRIAHTRRKCARTFATVLRLMERYPDYRFTGSQPQQYAYIREDHPDLYEGIRQAVADGRWEPVGGMWVEADCNVTSGESLVRQFLYGQRFFMKEFGKRTRVVWLPDVFGYSAAFPQIMRKAGMKYFMTIKIFWNQVNQPPYQTFRWVGIDGSDVLAHFSPLGDYNAQMTPAQFHRLWGSYAQRHLSDSALYVYGYGDGGGGPTADMLETAARARDFGAGPRVKLATSEAFFDDLERQVADQRSLPVWNGELYLEYHRGTYTSQAQTKQDNRRGEILLQTAEQAAALAMTAGAAPYPQEALQQAWELLLLHQFHDILPGSSIHEVYQDTAADFRRIFAAGERVVSGALGALAGAGVLAYNPLPWERLDPLLLPADAGAVGQAVTDLAGRAWTLVTPESVPPMGCFTVAARSVADDGALRVDEHRLENRFFRVVLDHNGEIASLRDRRAGDREVVDRASEWRGNALLAFEDRPLNWDAWDIDVFYQDKVYPLRRAEEIRVVERGPLRVGVEIRRVVAEGRGSVIRQRIYLHRDLPRIDFETWVDWREKQTLLKAAFPVTVNALRATYDIQFGSVERPTHWNTSWDWARFEVCGHKWADLSEGDYGVSLLSDSKYGWDIRGSVMRLTLLKSAVSPDAFADEGIHHFTYALLPHAGDWRAAETVRRAYELNVPVRAVRSPDTARSAARGDGVAGAWLAKVDAVNLVIETIKKAEDDDALVLRLYEAHNQRGRSALELGFAVAAAEAVNLMEDAPDGEAPVLSEDGRRVEFSYRPFEIKTFKLRLAR